MKLNKELQKEVIQKINNLYIMTRQKYLIMNKQGIYNTYFYEKNNIKLNDGHIAAHLQGKRTLGVFAGSTFTKFICFDVDIIDQNMAKWFTLKIVDTLINIGIPEENIYISFSGSKGYHVEIFFNEPIELEKAKLFYKLILNKTDLSKLNENDKIEFRPTEGQGVKIPLGKHFNTKNKNRCWYVDFNNKLNPIRNYKYILSLKQIDKSIIENIIHSELDYDLKELENQEVNREFEYLNSNYKPLNIYQLNIDENLTIDYYQKLEQEGLKQVGSRHKSLFNLCRYYRHLGMTLEENELSLINWMHEQDTRSYRTSLEETYDDIKKITKYIYEKEIGITNFNKEIYITYYEMLDIMNLKSRNDKLITYSMLIHNKRFSEVGKVFYMTYKQMSDTTGLALRTTKSIIPKIEKGNLLEIIERDTMILNERGQFVSKKPNKYRLKLNQNETNKIYTVNVNNKEINHTYDKCLLSLFTGNELKNLLTKNQYYELINSID